MRNLPVFPNLSRRSFLTSTTVLAGAALAGGPWTRAFAAAPVLTVGSRTIEVKGKAAKIFSVIGPGNRPGLLASTGDRFAGALLNASGEPLQMHWLWILKGQISNTYHVFRRYCIL